MVRGNRLTKIEKISIARKVLMSEMSEELVSDMTELNLEQVRKIKTEQDQ